MMWTLLLVLYGSYHVETVTIDGFHQKHLCTEAKSQLVGTIRSRKLEGFSIMCVRKR